MFVVFCRTIFLDKINNSKYNDSAIINNFISTFSQFFSQKILNQSLLYNFQKVKKKCTQNKNKILQKV